MRIIYLIISCTFILFATSAYSIDLYDQNELDRMKEIDKRIVDLSWGAAIEIGSVSGLYLSGQWVVAVVLGSKAAYDINEMISLLKERYSITKDAKERKEIQKAIDKLNSENSMDGYREQHSDEHSSCGESDSVGGLR